MTLPVDSAGQATSIGARNWGNCTHTTLFTHIPNPTSITNLGLTNVADAGEQSFLVVIERFNANGAPVTDDGLTFFVTDPTTTGLVVYSYRSSSTIGVNILLEGGNVTDFGNGNFQIYVTHTSTFSGFEGTTATATATATPIPITTFSDSNTGLYALLALPALLIPIASIALIGYKCSSKNIARDSIILDMIVQNDHFDPVQMYAPDYRSTTSPTTPNYI